MADLRAVRAIHVVGAGGAGMSALAKLLCQMGFVVSGSDLKFGEPLHELGELGIEVWQGAAPDRLHGVDLVVASSAVPDRDPELQRAQLLGIEVWRRPQLLRALTETIRTVGATGTHGKTTTAALMVACYWALGRNPSFVVGGRLNAAGTNGALGDRDLMVLEVDEAFGTFLGLQLEGLVVTNVEADHLDFYGTVERLEDAFSDVVAGVSGPVVICIDDAGGRRLARRSGRATYGTSDDADWRITLSGEGQGDVSFVLQHDVHGVAEVTVPKPGLHMARNAAGALALMGELGHDISLAARGVGAFRGVHRRFEERGTVNGVALIDDYAHHPTELTATLEASRHGSWKRVWAVFQPHRYTRTAALGRDLGSSLALADRVVVTDVYSAGETPIPGVSGAVVAEAAEAGAASVAYVPHRSDLAPYLAARVEAGDLVLSLGAGDISLLPDELARLLSRRS